MFDQHKNKEIYQQMFDMRFIDRILWIFVNA